MRALVVKRVSFCAAHFLPNYEGDCSRTHGHTWRLEVAVEGPIDKKSGMVVDFKELKLLLSPILSIFDHTLLNDTIENPTAENIALYIKDRLPQGGSINTNKVKWIRVWESEDSYAEVSNE